jgi:3-methyladenine DNA glycosylase/8-oxoguanine DNA glycosylase
MAKLSSETTVTINDLKQRSLEIVDKATAVEFNIFERFGETDQTVPFFEELVTVAEDAKSTFTRLSNLQLRIAEAQPIAASDMLELLTQVIARTTIRMPAWERSIEEVQIELNL